MSQLTSETLTITGVPASLTERAMAYVATVIDEDFYGGLGRFLAANEKLGLITTDTVGRISEALAQNTAAVSFSDWCRYWDTLNAARITFA
jgi:hypothetical protein